MTFVYYSKLLDAYIVCTGAQIMQWLTTAVILVTASMSGSLAEGIIWGTVFAVIGSYLIKLIVRFEDDDDDEEEFIPPDDMVV